MPRRISNLMVAMLVCLTSCDGDEVVNMDENTQKSVAPYGSWVSPLIASSIFESSDNIGYLTVEASELYFIEARAAAEGRNILVKLAVNGDLQPLTSSSLSVRTRVHEYGGRSYLVNGKDIYYSDFVDQKIYRLTPGAEPQPLTPDGLRYMDCIIDASRQQLICVREDHRGEGEAINSLVTIDLSEGGEGEILYSDSDFVTSPVLSPDGKSVAFVTWSHPNMPWDDTQLRIMSLNGEGVAIFQVPQQGDVALRHPAYAADGTLYFLADWTDWSMLYRLDATGSPELVFNEQFEVQDFVLENEHHALVSYRNDGLSYLARVSLQTGALNIIGDSFSSLGSLTRSDDSVYFVSSTSRTNSAIFRLQGDVVTLVYQPDGPVVDPAFLSVPQPIVFPTGDGEQAYGFFYPPENANFRGPKGTLPPLIVIVHGGPVAATDSSFSPRTQFWTSRGFAVFDVNHRGSTGYGRSFRKKLYPNWGIVDIEDVANGAKWLGEQGYVDAEKLAIRGGSAGGYTVLASVAYKNVFKAGTSYFGISDLEILARDTHKFESRYLDQLIGPYPESQEIYRQRSPINSVDQIRVPLLLLQGLDDKVVPPNQSEMIFEALKKNSVPTAYITFAGEGHGFRKPANNIKALNAELDFYGQVFGFEPAGNIESVELIR